MNRLALRRWIKWCLTITALVILLPTAISIFWGFGVTHRGWSIGFGSGVFTLGYVSTWTNVSWLINVNGPKMPSSTILLPRIEPFFGAGGWIAIIPLWIPFAAAAIPAIFLWRLDHRTPLGLCRACKYNLTGNTTGICPECGKAINTTAIAEK